MSDGLATAFGPLDARATPTADRISLRGHTVLADIGAFESERGAPQRLRFDVVVEVRTVAAALGDEVDRVLSYDTLTDAIAAELAAGRVALLETLAERIAARILAAPQAARVFLRIEKLDRGPGDLGVEIVRDASGVAPPKAQRSAEVRLAQPGDPATGPVVLVPAAPLAPPPPGPDAAATHRIALLALDQAAWAMAGPGRHVAASRTEIDWALGQGEVAVWAPSRLALEHARPDADPAALADWLRGHLAGA